MPRRRSTGCGPSSPGPPLPDVRADRGLPLDLPRPGRGRRPPGLHRQGDPQRRDPRRPPRRHAVRAGRAGRAGPPRPARRARLLERPGAHGRSGSGRLPGPRTGRAAAELAVWSGDTVVADDDGFLYFVGPARRDDQDLRLPGQPHRGRGGRVRHRPGARRRRARRRRRAARPADRARRQRRRGPAASTTPSCCAQPAPPSCRSTWCPPRCGCSPTLPRSPNGKFDRVRSLPRSAPVRSVATACAPDRAVPS